MLFYLMPVVKKLTAVVLLCFIYIASSAQQSSIIDSSYANGYYKQRLEFFKKMPDRKHEIVFLGNSITEAGEWQELVPGNVINRGISGDVTFGVIARLDEVLSSKPDKIFLLIGINDLKRGLPAQMILKNYQRIIRQVKSISPRTCLILQSILPVNESMINIDYKRITNTKVNDVNSQIQQLAVKEKLTFIDLHPVFEDSNHQMNKEYTIDGIHLKMPAYILWVNLLKSKGLL
jgi:lysophospholipase L1-like esterase